MSISTPVVVIDNGSGVMKVGLSSEEYPVAAFPSMIGRPKSSLAMLNGNYKADEIFLGNEACKFRGILSLKHPLEHGTVSDPSCWDDVERLWEYAYRCCGDVDPALHPVLLTEPPLNPIAHRRDAAQIMFEKFGVPSMHFSLQAVLSLYASGQVTGTVLDCGDSVTHVVPVFEGFSVPHAITRADYGGRDVTNYLIRLVREAGHVFHTSAEKDIVRMIKEDASAVWTQRDDSRDVLLAKYSRMPDTALSSLSNSMNSSGEPVTYVLPDGERIELRDERFQAPEMLFNPTLVGLEYPGLHTLLYRAISKCERDIRRDMYHDIYLAGGTCLTRDLPSRLLFELRALAPRDTRIRMKVPPKCNLTAWIGGAILAGLDTFRSLLVSKEEYLEQGVNVFATRAM